MIIRNPAQRTTRAIQRRRSAAVSKGGWEVWFIRKSSPQVRPFKKEP
jgi:hypothetical protein